MKQRQGTILSIGKRWAGAIEVRVRIDRAPFGASDFQPGTEVTALVYPQLCGVPEVAMAARIDVSALALALGTGGYAMVLSLGTLPPDDLDTSYQHVVKARYTPSQFVVREVADHDSLYHHLLAGATDVGGMPVVAADLHSALPAIVCGIRAARPAARIWYLYTDGGALPIWLSRTVGQLQEAGLLAGTISCGQAFGGDLEATTVAGAVMVAKHVGNGDIAVIAQGPGNIGTGTAVGFSGLDVGWALYQAHQVGALPVASLRVSAADPRPRHFGISHHSRTVLQRFTPLSVHLPVPDWEAVAGVEPEFCDLLATQLQDLGHHHLHPVPASAVIPALAQCPIPLVTMGRDYAADPTPFIGAGVSGYWAAQQIPA